MTGWRHDIKTHFRTLCTEWAACFSESCVCREEKKLHNCSGQATKKSMISDCSICFGIYSAKHLWQEYSADVSVEIRGEFSIDSTVRTLWLIFGVVHSLSDSWLHATGFAVPHEIDSVRECLTESQRLHFRTRPADSDQDFHLRPPLFQVSWFVCLHSLFWCIFKFLWIVYNFFISFNSIYFHIYTLLHFQRITISVEHQCTVI